MSHNTVESIAAQGVSLSSYSSSAECIINSPIKESIAEGVEGGKWKEKFCRKFLDNLNMRSLILSLVLSMLLLNFDVFCNSNSQLNQRESAPPRPFFSSSSKKYLIDYYTGNDAEPENLLHKSEIVIVMYYAPWSRRCIRTRVVFENVARSLSASSDVRKSHKTHTYPVIVAYIGKQSLMYTGLLASDYIYRWISRLRNPIRRLVTPFAIKSFFDEFDDTVIAFFHGEMAFDESYEFQQYVKAALIVFQRQDLLDKVGFAVVTNSSLARTVNSSPKTWIQLRSWDSTFNYDGPNITAYKIFEWIKNKALKSIGLHWISPEMNGIAKSEELLSVLQNGATVVVFIDRQVLYPHNWAVSVVEQTIMEYYSCSTELTDKLESRSIKRNALVDERNHLIAVSGNKCQKISARTRKVRKCCMAEKTSLLSRCFQCRSNKGVNFSENGSCSQLPLFFHNPYSSLFHIVPCLSVLSTLSEEELMNDCCTFLISKNQHLDVSLDTVEQCAKYRLARDLYRHISGPAPSTFCTTDATSIIGLSCGKNNSLRFVGVDGRYGDYFLKRLRRPYKGETVALIVDSSTERTFFMQAEFSRHTFRDFLHSFHSGTLTPHVISQTSRREPENAHLAHDSVSVLSSTIAESFKTDVSASEDTVIFFSGGSWHGPSASVIHVYHSVAHYFHPFLELIKFHMIDVSSNDLPWQFQMDTLPAVLFFPAGRKSSSSRFPALLPLTVPNLIAFIITRCQKELRWRLALSSCSFLCIKKNSQRLQKIALMIRNDITLLSLLASSNYQHYHLFQRLIRRRSEQLHSTRKLLRAVSASKFS
uniref:Thioredoxin domain-containing protein n=1 Tax=Setaria digitata TaxID=48799 RepID=A0A915PRR8_9BILA